jgi:hypothetical protein
MSGGRTLIKRLPRIFYWSGPIPRQATFLILKSPVPRHSQKWRGTGLFKITYYPTVNLIKLSKYKNALLILILIKQNASCG